MSRRPGAPAATARRVVLHGVAFLALGAAIRPGTGHAQTRRRLVSVGGALTEIVYALGAGAELVGVDSTSLHPPPARTLKGVGYARALSVEGILSLAPTQVIATADAGPPAVLAQLRQAGVPIAVLPVDHRFDGLVERVNAIGSLLDRRTEADTLVRQLRHDHARVMASIASERGATAAPRVLFALAHGGAQWQAAGRGTAADAMIALAGLDNAVSGFDGYKPLGAESILAARPEVVVTTEQGLLAAGGVDGVLRRPGLERTPAGRHRRVVALDALYLLGFGPRLPAAVTDLRAAVVRAVAA